MPETVLSKPENATFKSSPYMSATKNVKLGSAFGLEVIAARGLMIARLTGFRDQVIVPAGACPEATAAIYTAMASTVKTARDVATYHDTDAVTEVVSSRDSTDFSSPMLGF